MRRGGFNVGRVAHHVDLPKRNNVEHRCTECYSNSCTIFGVENLGMKVLEGLFQTMKIGTCRHGLDFHFILHIVPNVDKYFWLKQSYSPELSLLRCLFF